MEKVHSVEPRQYPTSFGEGRREKGCCKIVPRQSPTQLRLSARKMVGALFLEHLIAHNGSHFARSVHHYFKLPGGDKSKCTHWEKSVKLYLTGTVYVK
jgi:hypothetical protein